MVSCGLREVVRYLAQHRLVDAIVTTAGGIEEDFIKCMAPTVMGEFTLDGATLRERGLNRIGNLLVPNENYCSSVVALCFSPSPHHNLTQRTTHTQSLKTG